MTEEKLRAVERLIGRVLNGEVSHIHFGPIFARADLDPDGSETVWVHAIHDAARGYIEGAMSLDLFPPIQDALRSELAVTAFPVVFYVHKSEEPEWTPEVFRAAADG